ncbi:MAG: phosphomannomutase/phosphoglucomutase [Clostridiales bacterium]|nr:phosphomannomutase/phosphoglucomutase [Clostridiales bacterium]
MNKEFFYDLKSGTDIRGVAVKGIEGQEFNLSDEAIHKIISAFALWLGTKQNKDVETLTVSVGRDSRITGKHILDICAHSLKNYGIRVLDCGLASTPSMFMTTLDLKCDGAVMITASHHPYYRNGLKFFTPNGGLEGTDITSILDLAVADKSPKLSNNGEIIITDYMSDYSRHLRDIICKGINSEDYSHPLKGFKIAVDAGNGAGGFYADMVLKPLGADISASRFLEPDGMFPNHVPNPENKDAMKAISSAVIDNKCDLGVIFDTDVDRGAAVDSTGKEISRNRLVALASAIALEDNPGGTVVTDSITSDGVTEFIERELGGKHRRFKRGYKNVINEALRLNREGICAPLAIETSGHAAMSENYFLDDGAYLCTKIIIKAVKLKKQGLNLNSVLSKLKEPLEADEYRLKILDKDFKAYGNSVLKDLEQYALENGIAIVPNNYEGVRLSFNKDNGDGWCLLRLSVHDPIMPLNIESNSQGGINKIIKLITPFLSRCNKLDLINLNL